VSQATAPTSVLARHTTSTRLHPHSTTLLTAFHRSTLNVATERCLPCHSMLRDGRHLQSCCSTLVSTVYTQQRSSLVSTATSLPGQPPSLFHTDSLAADGLALESLVARNRRSRCFAAIVGCSCYPRLGSRHRWHCHRLHRAFATLPRTRLIRPLHRRGNHFKHFICQGCNGRSLIFRLSISMLFFGRLEGSRPRVWYAWRTGEDHQHQEQSRA
jgi:hypothetical protein